MNSGLSKEIRSLSYRLLLLHTGSFIFLVCLSLYSTWHLKRDLAAQVAEMCRRSMLVGDNRQTILYLESVVPKNFDSIKAVAGSGQNLFIVPTTMNAPEADSPSIVRWLRSASLSIPLRYDDSNREKMAVLTFSFDRFEGVLAAAGIWVLFFLLSLPMLRQARKHVQARFDRESELSRKTAIVQMAEQVSHDIRSPLAALDMVVKSLSDLPEEKRLLVRSSIGRIKDIANNLLEKKRTENGATSLSVSVTPTAAEESTVHLLSSLIEGLVSEKRMQFRSKIGIEIDANLGESSYGIFARIQLVEFKRILSNLINNAVEVLNSSGRVTITLKQEQGHAMLSITDNGRGIPPEILKRLGNRGETHGKDGGSGLGLYHARTTVESWGGRFKIESMVGIGTTITLALPLAPSPAWFVRSLELEPNTHVVVLDDDTSIHQIWNDRLEGLIALNSSLQVHNFSTPEQLRSWLNSETRDREPALFLIDYELLGFRETGLDLIDGLALAREAVLVTSRYEEPFIREQCEKLGVPLIPKGMAGFVPLALKRTIKRVDAILIDDDSLVHSVWQIGAQAAGKALVTFATPEEFMARATEFSKEVPVYVDVSLGNGVRGEDVARKIHDMGFSNILLATGHSPENFKNIAFIKGVIGKDPPF